MIGGCRAEGSSQVQGQRLASAYGAAMVVGPQPASRLACLRNPSASSR